MLFSFRVNKNKLAVFILLSIQHKLTFVFLKQIKEFPGKGRGVITKKHIKRGEFVLEYYGELIDYEEAKEREALYATKENTGCYMYYFKFRNKRFW